MSFCRIDPIVCIQLAYTTRIILTDSSLNLVKLRRVQKVFLTYRMFLESEHSALTRLQCLRSCICIDNLYSSIVRVQPMRVTHSYYICDLICLEVPEGIGYSSSFTPSFIDGVLKIGDVSAGNCYMNNHTLSKQDCYSNSGDISSGNGFINSHTISQCTF